MRRYPLAALAEAAGVTEAALGRRVGLSGSTLKNARALGFTEAAADRYAVRAGLHPAEVWPDFGLVPCALGRVFVASSRGVVVQPGCDRLFAPRRKGHVYCGQRCAQRAWERSPEGKASLAAAKRRWRASAAEYAKAYDRAYSARRKAERGKGEVAA